MKLSFSLLFASMTVVSAKSLRKLEGHLPVPEEDSFDEPMIDGGGLMADCPEAADGVQAPMKPPAGENPCEGTNPLLPDVACYVDAIEMTGPQAAANVTYGYQGDRETDSVPISSPYWDAGLCPVNVHWHLGAEHLSVGEYDEAGSGPTDVNARRKLAGKSTQAGFQCNSYDETDPKFTTPYDWKYCTDMEVGQTYEVHWPHSSVGACGTPNQYQSPFTDGLFCNLPGPAFDELVGGPTGHQPLTNNVAVQAQVFVVVNDENYYYPNLFDGMITEGEYGTDLAIYSGSTTSTKYNNEVCSQYAPVTWQVDRKCHLISASSFDYMCSRMKQQRSDMSMDLSPGGSRELVVDALVANNHANLRK